MCLLPFALGLVLWNAGWYAFDLANHSRVLLVIAGAMMSAFVGRMHNFQCPRCGDRFFGNNFFRRSCRSCGLKIGEIPLVARVA